jgi:LytS/YehU family sensor histidine kinase
MPGAQAASAALSFKQLWPALMSYDRIPIVLHVSLIIILVLNIVSFLILGRLKRYHDLLTAEMKSKLMRRRMDPHFIGNLLQSAVGLIYSGRREQAVSMMHEYSLLVKSNFEHLDVDLITLSKELKFLNQYLHTRNIISEGKLFYEFRLACHSPTKDIVLPAMLLQPLVENALDHGLKDHPHPKIIIEFLISKNLRIRIIDNGTGMPELLKKQDGSLHVTIDRLKLLSKMHQQVYSLYIMHDLSEYSFERGCGIEINIPLIQTI